MASDNGIMFDELQVNLERMISVDCIINALEHCKVRLPFFDTPCINDSLTSLLSDFALLFRPFRSFFFRRASGVFISFFDLFNSFVFLLWKDRAICLKK